MTISSLQDSSFIKRAEQQQPIQTKEINCFISSLEGKLSHIDIYSLQFFTVALFRLEKKSFSISTQDLFLEFISKILAQNSRFSFDCIMIFISFNTFRKKFHSIIKDEIKQHRSSYLLNHADAVYLVHLDLKASQHYFNSLELQNLITFISTQDHPEQWIETEFKKIKRHFLLKSARHYMNFFLFWLLIILAIYIGLQITSKENSFTIFEQLHGWLRFITKGFN